jgi:hypothetical protein
VSCSSYGLTLVSITFFQCLVPGAPELVCDDEDLTPSLHVPHTMQLFAPGAGNSLTLVMVMSPLHILHAILLCFM